MSVRGLLRVVLLGGAFIASSAAGPTKVIAGVSDAGPDATLALIVHDLEQGHLDVAQARTENLLRIYPNFRLGYLIQGDLLQARARGITTLGDAKDAPQDRLQDLRDEALARIHGYANRPPNDVIPSYLLQMPADQQYAIVVDTRRSRLYVYRNDHGRPVFMADYYVSQGKAGAHKTREGDLKTPVGVYRVTSWLPRAKLGDFYGIGAFPINYPNAWDRMNGRDGHGIWLHGVPSDTYARPPKTSEGCVVLSNQDLGSLSAYMQIGTTPVIIGDGVQWLSLGDWQAQRKALDHEIDSWRTDWESRDVDRYLRHYSHKFRTGKMDFDDLARQKRQVAAGKSFIKVSLRNMSVFRNPGPQEMVVVSFDQEYRSNNLSTESRKQQYWVKEDGQWKIIYEGTS